MRLSDLSLEDLQAAAKACQQRANELQREAAKWQRDADAARKEIRRRKRGGA